jgi:hypothetical protein
MVPITVLGLLCPGHCYRRDPAQSDQPYKCRVIPPSTGFPELLAIHDWHLAFKVG